MHTGRASRKWIWSLKIDFDATELTSMLKVLHLFRAKESQVSWKFSARGFRIFLFIHSIARLGEENVTCPNYTFKTNLKSFSYFMFKSLFTHTKKRPVRLKVKPVIPFKSIGK